MAVSESDKSLIASSEFDPANFVKGIDLMAAALEKLTQQESQIQAELKSIDAALKQNRTEYRSTTEQINSLDKSSKTYKVDLSALTAQKKLLNEQAKTLKTSMAENQAALENVNKSATTYKNSLQLVATTTKQVSEQNKGRQLFDVGSLSQQVTEVTQSAGKLRNVFQGKIPTAELDKFEAALSETNDEFAQLGQVITFVKSKLDTLDPDSQEFEDLNRIIETGEQVLAEYGKTAEDTGKKTGSLRSQLSAMKNELALLEDQGKDNTKEFQDLAVQAGRLEDQLGDTRERIRVLASDTKNLDFGIAAIKGVASAFGLAEGAAALFGIKNEQVEETIKRLNSIMLILNGLTEIQNALKKESVLRVVGEEIALKASAVAQRVYAIAVGTSTGAMKAFRVALLATGIGAFVVILGLAADAMGLFGGKTEDATEKSDAFNRSIESSIEFLDNRTRAIKESGELAGLALERQGATEKELAERRIDALEDEREALRVTYIQLRQDQDKFIAEGGDIEDEAFQKAEQNATQIFGRIQNLNFSIDLERARSLNKQVEDQKKALDKQAQLYEAYINRLTNLQRSLRDKLLAQQPQDEQQIRLQFAQQLSDAFADIDKEIKSGKLTQQQGKTLQSFLIQSNQVDTDVAIREFLKSQQEAERDFSDQLFDLRLKSGQERIELIRDQFTREAALVRTEARQQTEQLTREREDLIRGINQTRDAGLISPQTAQQNIERVQVIYEQLLNNLTDQTARKQEEISNRVFESSQNELKTIFESVQLTVSETATDEIVAANELLQSGAINYEQYQKRLTKIAEDETRRRIATSQREAEALLKATNAQIQEIQAKPVQDQDKERLEKLQAEARALRKQISDLKREEVAAEEGVVTKDHEARAKRIQEVAAYAQAIGGIINQVVSFWQQANEAEQKSLEKSIALQETRVEAARRLAEKGNSEFLRLEEDRLNELQTKQENAARKQIAINAVLQTSQALTAFVSALAQGIALGGPLGGIAIAASVIGAISAGYAIIQSLRPQTQSFFKGEKYVKREGQPAGKDTIPAMLNEGEAVIPTDTNKEYHPTVAAIFDKKIPPEVINNFVNNYKSEDKSINPYYEAVREIRAKGIPVDRLRELRKSYESNTKVTKTELVNQIVNNLVNDYRKNEKTISSLINNYPANNRVFPQLDAVRMTEATEVHISKDGELLQATKEQTRRVQENTEYLQRVEEKLSKLEISVNIDRHGLAISLMKMVEKFNIEKRS